MSNRTYPCFDSWLKLRPNTTSMCRATGCESKATREVWIRVSYMRGEDESVRACDAHAAIARQTPAEFVILFPKEAWK